MSISVFLKSIAHSAGGRREDVPMWAGVLKERLDRAEVELADFTFSPGLTSK